MHTLTAAELKADYTKIFSTFKDKVNKFRRSGQNRSRWADFCLKDYKKTDGDVNNRLPMVWLLGHALKVTELPHGELARLEGTHEQATDETTPQPGIPGDNAGGQGHASTHRGRRTMQSATPAATTAVHELAAALKDDPLAHVVERALTSRQADQLSTSERLHALRAVADDPEESSENRAEARREIRNILGISS